MVHFGGITCLIATLPLLTECFTGLILLGIAAFLCYFGYTVITLCFPGNWPNWIGKSPDGPSTLWLHHMTGPRLASCHLVGFHSAPNIWDLRPNLSKRAKFLEWKGQIYDGIKKGKFVGFSLKKASLGTCSEAAFSHPTSPYSALQHLHTIACLFHYHVKMKLIIMRMWLYL